MTVCYWEELLNVSAVSLFISARLHIPIGWRFRVEKHFQVAPVSSPIQLAKQKEREAKCLLETLATVAHETNSIVVGGRTFGN